MNRREWLKAVGTGCAMRPAMALASAPAAEGVLLKARPFPMSAVRLLPGPFLQAQEANRAYLHRLPVERLIHNFRLNAGLPSAAQPLGGWERPDCELRGHFTGHYLSACALAWAGTRDRVLKERAEAVVAELARCQQALGGGYLSAFPAEFFERLKARKKVWAPFYTLHKIMAGLLDVHLSCGNSEALATAERLADWVDRWSEPLSEAHMQEVLQTEFGGMNEVLYNLWAVTGEARWGRVGDRFHHKRFFDPLALRRDELTRLHVNTQVPKVIGFARRYELTGERRYRDAAEFFFYEVTGARCYATGGTSNAEAWLTEPLRLAEELRRSANTAECCVAYNLLKLTRRLYQWTADPRYFDYYERTLLNHRLGTIHPGRGVTQYYLSLAPGAWRTFAGEWDSFWCCTGTGIEEFAKLNDSIYFCDDQGLFVNLFVASELDWPERGLRLRQQTRFPEQGGVAFSFELPRPVRLTLRIRVPWWAEGARARLNRRPLEASAGAGGYLVLDRVFRQGDRLELDLPMRLRAEPLPDDPTLAAVLYGPLVLAGELGREGLSDELVYGKMGPDVRRHPIPVPELGGDPERAEQWLKPAGGERPAFRTAEPNPPLVLSPFYRILDQRYNIYWRLKKAGGADRIAGSGAGSPASRSPARRELLVRR